MSGSRVTGHASRVLALVVLLLMATDCFAANAPFEPGKDGWLTLFDGSDLSRWKPGKDSDWALKDGVLAGSKGEITNYWYWLDFEMAALCRGTGSIRVRVSHAPMADQPGYRLDLSDGTLRAADDRVVAKGQGSKKSDWRALRLTVSNGLFTVEFDGVKVAEGSDTAYPAKGYVALAADGQPVQFKLLRARPLNREKHVNVPAPDTACFVCHDNFEKERIARIHSGAKREKRGGEEDEDDKHLKPASQRPKASGCLGCHGSSFDHRSDEDNVTTPDVMYTRGEVKAACLQCHTPHKAERKRKDGKDPLPPNPVCTDCHGRHTCKN